MLPFWQGQHAVANLRDNSRGCLTSNTTVTLVEQSQNTHCLATNYYIKEFENEVGID